MISTDQHTTKEEFLRWYQAIHPQFIRYCRSKALGLLSTEDLAQEAILATLSAFEQVRDKEKLLSYMIGVVNNLIRNYLRRQKFKASWNEQMAEQIQAKVADPELALDIQYLYQMIQKLGAKEQEAILLFEISGFSIKELAEIQQSSSAAVKTRLHRARKKLKKLMTSTSQRSLSDQMAVLTSIFL